MNKRTVIRVAVLWNDTVFSETLLNPAKGGSLGIDKRSNLRAPIGSLLGVGEYPLFTAGSETTAQLNVDPKMTGWLEKEGERSDLTSASGINTLSQGDRGLINITDELAVFFYVTEQSTQTYGIPFLGNSEPSFFTALLFAMLLHFGVLIAAFAGTTYRYAIDFRLEDHFTEVISQKIDEVDPDELEEEEEEDDVGKQAGGEEGKFGQEDKLDKSKVPTTDGELVDKIKNVGLAKALSSSLMGRGALSSVFGNRDGFSDQLNAAMSGGDGELVMGHGAGGMGLRGTGSGGGGSGFGRIHGMGKIDTGGGRGTKARLGGRGKAKKKFKVRRGRPSVGNFCKQADILRVVNRRQRGIQYCYEKELARNPELGGKVILQWNIGLDGKVMKVWVGSSTLKNGTVESCMTRTVKRWKFTKPDGGICQIKFPFVFNSGI